MHVPVLWVPFYTPSKLSLCNSHFGLYNNVMLHFRRGGGKDLETQTFLVSILRELALKERYVG